MVEGLALTGAGQLGEQLSEMRRFQLLETATAILGRVSERIRLGADEGTARLSVAEIDMLHGDDLVDDSGQFASGLAAFDLQLPGRDVEVVDDLFEDPDEDDIL